MSLKKKRVRKSIALVLVGVMVVTPIMNNVSAMENNYINSHIEIQENIEYFENVETYIKELYGTEDKFYPSEQIGNSYSEINPHTGILRINNIDDIGNITTIYQTNIFESAKEIVNDLEDTYESETKEIESRKAIVYKKQMTGSPIDKFSLAVFSHGDYKSHFRISIGNDKGTLKNYYKNDSWDTGNTAKFKSSLIKAQGNVSSIKKKVVTGAAFATAMSAVKNLVTGNSSINKDDIASLLIKVGISAVTAASVAPDVLAYLINVRNCGSYYNIIINGKS